MFQADQILMIFAQMLEIVALSDLASVLCARKFLFMLFWPKKVFVTPKNVEIPYDSDKVFRFFGLLALAEGPMDSRSSVRAFVRSSVARYLEIRASDFFWNLAQSCILARLKKCSKPFFEKNSRFPPGGFLAPKPPFFGWKMAFWAYIFEIVHHIFDDFFIDVRYYCT